MNKVPIFLFAVVAVVLIAVVIQKQTSPKAPVAVVPLKLIPVVQVKTPPVKVKEIKAVVEPENWEKKLQWLSKEMDQYPYTDERDQFGAPDLFAAVDYKGLDLALKKLKMGADPNLTKEDPHLCEYAVFLCAEGFPPLIRAKNQKVCEMLIKAGADPNLRDRWGLPPIFYAAKAGRLDVLDCLVESGADVRGWKKAEDWMLMTINYSPESGPFLKRHFPELIGEIDHKLANPPNEEYFQLMH